MGQAQRIGVLTFHRCINYGSYWQARALVEGLAARGFDAELLDHRDRSVTWAEWRCAFQPTLPVRSERGDLPHYGAKARRFLQAFDERELPRERTQLGVRQADCSVLVPAMRAVTGESMDLVVRHRPPIRYRTANWALPNMFSRSASVIAPRRWLSASTCTPR